MISNGGLEKLRVMPVKVPQPEDQGANEGAYSPNSIDISVQDIGRVTVVILRVDSITAANAAAFKSRMQPFCVPQARIVLDLGEVRFVDSAGIGAIMSCVKTLKSRDGFFRICHVTSSVIALFKLVQLDRLVDIYASREDAIEAFF